MKLTFLFIFSLLAYSMSSPVLAGCIEDTAKIISLYKERAPLIEFLNAPGTKAVLKEDTSRLSNILEEPLKSIEDLSDEKVLNFISKNSKRVQEVRNFYGLSELDFIKSYLENSSVNLLKLELPRRSDYNLYQAFSKLSREEGFTKWLKEKSFSFKLSRQEIKRVSNLFNLNAINLEENDFQSILSTNKKFFSELGDKFELTSEEALSIFLKNFNEKEIRNLSDLKLNKINIPQFIFEKLGRKEAMKFWLSAKNVNFNELISMKEKIKRSSEIFELSEYDFIKRLYGSNFGINEYYTRVELLKRKKSFLQNTKSILKRAQENIKKTVTFFNKNLGEFLNISPEFSVLRAKLAGASGNKQRAQITSKFMLSLPPIKAKKLFNEISSSFHLAKSKVMKNLTQTRLINSPDFKKVMGIAVLVDNMAMGITHVIKHGVDKFGALGMDLGTFSVLEVLLSTMTFKEAAYLEAFPELMKKSKFLMKERATNLTKSEVQESISLFRRTGRMIKNFGAQSIGLVKEGGGLGAKTFVLSSLFAVGPINVVAGMEGAQLIYETTMMSGLVGFFFATSSTLRYKILNSLIIPNLSKSKLLRSNDKLRSAAIFVLSSLNVVGGTLTWFWYRDGFEVVKEEANKKLGPVLGIESDLNNL